MLLALNIGNTNVTFGGYDSAGQRVFASRFYSDSALSSDELVYKLVNMLALYHIQPRDVDAAILASVVPVLRSPGEDDQRPPDGSRPRLKERCTHPHG